MFKEFLKHLEKRPRVEDLVSRHVHLFQADSVGAHTFSQEGFKGLLAFLEEGEPSFRGLAVEAGVKWAAPSQRVLLRNAIVEASFLTPLCLWGYKCLRGNTSEIFEEYSTPEMNFMQILLAKGTNPAEGLPFLIERFLTARDVPEELRSASRLCVLRLLDASESPALVQDLRSRYSKVETLFQWRPGAPTRDIDLRRRSETLQMDFHQLVRSVHDMKELSSLTRVIYLTSLFHTPLADKDWRSLLLSKTDQVFFHRLICAGIVERNNGGFAPAGDAAKQTLVRKFLFDNYTLARESVHRTQADRRKEDRERRVRNSELDRQALDALKDGIICVDGTSFLYYMNRSAERLIHGAVELKELLFGEGSVEEALRRYTGANALSTIKRRASEKGLETEIFGARIAVTCAGKRFEIELAPRVILIRDTTDQYLIDREIGQLYRHELNAALDVIGAGVAAVGDGLRQGSSTEECLALLDQVEERRSHLRSMLEDRMDFIRLHSDGFKIRPAVVNLNLVVDTCVANYRDAASAGGLSLESNHLSVPGVMVLGEERFLIRAVDNILRNAVKFCDSGAGITVEVGDEGRDAFVAVKDTGPGITPERMGKIFSLGFTTGGTGRGLYIARRIARAHGGRIDVSGKPGLGSVFTLRLPLKTES